MELWYWLVIAIGLIGSHTIAFIRGIVFYQKNPERFEKWLQKIVEKSSR